MSCRVSKQFGADTVKVAAGVRAGHSWNCSKSLPKGVQLRIVYDQSELVRSSLCGVGRAVLLGAFFVVLVLFVLLGDLRAALIVTFTIPLSIGARRHSAAAPNVGLNTMTLGGLAIAVGLLVDAAIIVTENIVHRLTQHRAADRMKIALAAAIEVGRPITFATLIVVAVFTPLVRDDGDRRAHVQAAGRGGRSRRWPHRWCSR